MIKYVRCMKLIMFLSKFKRRFLFLSTSFKLFDVIFYFAYTMLQFNFFSNKWLQNDRNDKLIDMKSVVHTMRLLMKKKTMHFVISVINHRYETKRYAQSYFPYCNLITFFFSKYSMINIFIKKSILILTYVTCLLQMKFIYNRACIINTPIIR